MNTVSSAPSLRILIVDDAATNRQILQVFLAKLGYPTLTATNGEEAVALFSKERPDLVLMDVMMPVMDGYEATRQIKAMCGKDWIPVIFLSALDKDENLVMGLDAGGDDYITKPINFVILDAKIRSVLRTLQMQRQLNAAQKQMAAISSTIVDGVITIDQRGTIQWVNQSTQRIFGYSVAELIGQNIRLLMPSPYQEAHDEFLASFSTSGRNTPFGGGMREVPAKRKNGQAFPLEIGVSVMDVDGGHYYVGIVRDITDRKTIEQQLRSNAERLQRYYDQQEHENLLTQSLMERVSEHSGLNDPLIQRWISPASNFSGDSISALRSTENTLTAMLSDATGHGLAAAVSILPLVSTFYGMVEVNRKLAYIVERINHRLHVFLPTGRFVAATLIHVDESTRTAEIWQGGTPTVFWLHADGSVKQRFEPDNLALGVVDTGEIEQQINRVRYQAGEQFVLYSDGVPEAENAAGESFGEARLLAALASADSAHRLDALRNALREHLNGHDHQDDISVLLIDCH